MRTERSDHTLQPTALVNEAYLRLMPQGSREWQSRSHFLAAAAQVMRRVLVDYARARRSKKRGGDAVRLQFDDHLAVAGAAWENQMIDLDAALSKLAELDPRQVRALEARYFAGMTEAEIAEVEGVSERTVKRDCKAGLAWLNAELSPARAATAKSRI
jgi:RNA polymerase sigma factor (TIGR02999 family)